MGKVKGIFASNISGRVGNVVFRKNGSENIVSQRPASVKNPRSEMQQRQRAYIKSVASAYSVLRPLCDHSFEGVAYGGRSMNYFNKINYQIVSGAQKAVLKNSSDVIVPVAFQISKGIINWNGFNQEEGVIATLSKYMQANNITDLAAMTYKQLLEALMLQDGDQLTVVNIKSGDNVYTGPNMIQQESVVMSYSRYIFSGQLQEKAFVKSAASETKFNINPKILLSTSQVSEDAKITAVGMGEISVETNGYGKQYMHSAIVSRKVGDVWARSTAFVFVDDKSMEGSYDIDTVLPSYMPTDERYLNNAEK